MTDRYKEELDRMTLSELLDELEIEEKAVQDMENDGGGYEDYSRMLQAARENVAYIKKLISKKS